MNNRFAIILIALVAVFAGVFVTTKQKNEPANSNGSPATAQATSHIYGSGAKEVTLVEYGDYQCPACTAYYPIVKQVVEAHKADIKFQFVNFPLTQIHQNAMAAARTAEAADKQGKFWEMHDMIYSQASSWNSSQNATAIFEQFAQQLGLDMNKFRSDFSSGEVNSIIQADIKKGTNLGVNSTPTFYLNGEKLASPPQDAESFNKLIEQAIAAKTNK